MRWPGYMRRQARRQISALERWGKKIGDDVFADHELRRVIRVSEGIAQGYFEAQDWIGVEAQYRRAADAIQRSQEAES